MSTKSVIVAILGLGLLLCPVARAGPPSKYELRVDAEAVPLVLTGSTGHDGWNVRWLSTTLDGFVIDYDDYASGYEYHTLDPALEERNDATTGACQVARVQVWLTSKEYYRASVAAGEKISTGNAASSGMTRSTSSNSHLLLSGGGTFGLDELQFQDTAGVYDADSGSAARLLDSSVGGIDTGLHKTGIDLISQVAGTGTYNAIMGTNTSDNGTRITRPIRKLQIGPLTGLDPVTPLEGDRTTTGGGRLTGGSGGTAQSLIDDLPGDEVADFAYNPADGNVYFVSSDTVDGKVYLSAVSFDFGLLADDSPTTSVDLDPDSATDYLEITYDPAGNPNDLSSAGLLRGNSLAFSADGSRLFVGNMTGSHVGDRVYQFDIIPEPTTIALLGLGSVALGVLRRRRK